MSKFISLLQKDYPRMMMNTEPHPLVRESANDLIISNAGRMLDIGCGYGNNTKWLINRFNLGYDAFDPDEVCIDIARSKFGLRDAKVCKAQDFTFKKTYYDLILYMNVAMYLSISEQKEILENIAYSTRLNGLLFYSVMTNWNDGNRNVLEDGDVITLLHKHGFIFVRDKTYSEGNKEFKFIVFERKGF